MSKWEQQYGEYCALWRKKGKKAAGKELESMRKYLHSHHDGFSQISAPDELSDGDRIMALREVVSDTIL